MLWKYCGPRRDVLFGGVSGGLFGCVVLTSAAISGY